MNDVLPPPAGVPASSAPRVVNMLVLTVLLLVLGMLGGGGYLLWQQLQQMAQAKPQAPSEITDALAALHTQLERQRSDSARQLQTLQQELAAVKEQAAAIAPTPDIGATLAPVQEKLDAIAAQLEEKPGLAATPVVAEATVPPQPAVGASPNSAGATLLNDYFALRRAALSGAPYAAQLATVIPQLDDTQQDAIATLLAHAELGLDATPARDTAAATADNAAPPLAPWMQQLNSRLHGLVHIRPAPPAPPPAATASSTDARSEVLRALDAIGTRITQGP